MTSNRSSGSPDEIRESVKQDYTRVVEQATGCGGAARDGQATGCCGDAPSLAALRPGQVVVDLGSGAGFDAFLAARAVGPGGRVIGVDMTDAMLERARANALQGGYANVEFRKGTIEALPLEDESVDVVISNCVINLSPEKDRVFREAFRVLRPGGSLMISDIVLERPLPAEVEERLGAYLGCVGGASVRGDYLETIEKAGFRQLSILREASLAGAFSLDHPQVREGAEQLGVEPERVQELLGTVTSVHVRAVKAESD
jgi:SAM-dependent methyltransferase